jgi:hypothetical protein
MYLGTCRGDGGGGDCGLYVLYMPMYPGRVGGQGGRGLWLVCTIYDNVP